MRFHAAYPFAPNMRAVDICVGIKSDAKVTG